MMSQMNTLKMKLNLFSESPELSIIKITVTMINVLTTIDIFKSSVSNDGLED